MTSQNPRLNRTEDLESYSDSSRNYFRECRRIVGLEGEVETFLYDAKNYLRTVLGVINVFFDETFDEASAWRDPKGDGDGALAKWATARFGTADPFTQMLTSEQQWVGDIIRRRNAVEHPGGRSGTLYIENLTLHPNGKMVMPVWWSNVGVGQNLPQALDVTLVNLCTLAENIFVQCIRHSGLPEYVAFYEIPVEKRDLTCPKRIGVTLHHSKLKPPMTPPAA